MALWKALKTQGTPSFLLRLIKDLHGGTISCVRTVSGDVSDSFPTSSGVRQGCILAPALFCGASDGILRRIVSALRVTIGSSTFADMDYADDAVLFVDCPANSSSPFNYSTKQPGQWECTLPGLRQRFRMSARGHCLMQLPSMVTALTPRKG